MTPVRTPNDVYRSLLFTKSTPFITSRADGIEPATFWYRDLHARSKGFWRKFHTTVNVVIFAGVVSIKCWENISPWGNFLDTTPISFIKTWFFFAWGLFSREDKSVKKTKITQTQKFPRLQYPCVIFNLKGKDSMEFYPNCILLKINYKCV